MKFGHVFAFLIWPFSAPHTETSEANFDCKLYNIHIILPWEAPGFEKPRAGAEHKKASAALQLYIARESQGLKERSFALCKKHVSPARLLKKILHSFISLKCWWVSDVTR